MNDFITQFKEIFRNRESAFSVGVPLQDKPDKFGYPPKRDPDGNDVPLSDDYLLAHFKGDIQLGVYPLFDTDKVQFAAMDFDGGDGNEDPVEKASEQIDAFAQKGITSYLEISRSGSGAHVWVFFEEPISAKVVRAVLGNYLVESSTYDRMFPNQDSAGSGYGNLIALPYNGAGYKEGKSVFVDPLTKEVLEPKKFIPSIFRNKVSYFESLYTEVKETVSAAATTSVTRVSSRETLSGAIKVLTFCKWMKAARARMYQQNQEPEFYALCCQFAQLEDGERLAYEFGRLHPYSDARIKQKFEQAVRTNKPHTCRVLREEMGYECTCDIDFGVNHCYELANKSFQELVGSRKGELVGWSDLGKKIIERTKKIYKDGVPLGYAYGYDRLDDMTSLRNGNLVIIGARTSIGKTSFAIDISANLNNQGVPVYWMSMEMSGEEMGIKYLGRQAGVDSRSIMEGTLDRSDWSKILRFQRDNPDLPLYVDDQTKDLSKMLDVLAEKVYTYGKGVVILDYIEMVKPLPGESMQQLTSRVSLESKGIARVLDVPVIALSNFNRKAEADQLEGSQPEDGWLRNSGLLEQTADVIIYLLGKRGKGLIKRVAHIQKERFTGMAFEQCNMWFNQAHSQFSTYKPNEVDGKILINTAMEQNNLEFL